MSTYVHLSAFRLIVNYNLFKDIYLFVCKLTVCMPAQTVCMPAQTDEICLFQVVVVTDYAEGELFQILEDDGSLPEEQV